MFSLALVISTVIPLGLGVMVYVEVPKLILAGGSTTLYCQYDLEGESLNSVKWYRDQYEFYRYRPEQNPAIRTFPLPGINVDVSGSNANQITLQNVPKNLTGKFVCEVSADGPKFHTGSDSAVLTVTDMQIRKPLLLLSSSVYQPGSNMKIQCLAHSTEPPPKISFLINETLVEKRWVKPVYPGVSELIPDAFNESLTKCASLIGVRCEAYLLGVYQLTSASVPVMLQRVSDFRSCGVKSRGLVLIIFLPVLTGMLNV